jgi:hypothetical protein
MDYGLAAITVRIFFFDNGGSVTRLSFLDDCGTITIAVVIMRLADRHASANRTYVNTNIIRKHGCRDSADYDGNKQRLPHFHPPTLISGENAITG